MSMPLGALALVTGLLLLRLRVGLVSITYSHATNERP